MLKKGKRLDIQGKRNLMPLANRKGKSGENELCRWLDFNLDIDAERNYNQADGHSADIIIDDFIIEVKRREVLDLSSWWYQVSIAKQHHKDKDLIPVVAFRQNKKPWQFLVPASLIGVDRGFLIASEQVFLEFASKILKRDADREN